MAKTKFKINKKRFIPAVIFVVMLTVLLGSVVFELVLHGNSMMWGSSDMSIEAQKARAEKKNNPYGANKKDPYLVLVNKDNRMTDKDKPNSTKAVEHYTDTATTETCTMETKAANAFNRLTSAAEDDGVEIVLTTGYRSYSTQKKLYDYYVNKFGESKANKQSAKPGWSEHQTGLAADTSSPEVNYQLTQDYADTAAGKWLAKHAHTYGFIIRYPKGKQDITGYEYEPWHIRYVGTKAADVIYKNDLTLEEYLGED